MGYLGTRAVNSTVYVFVTTHAHTGAAVAPSSALEVADFVLYKNGSATQRTSQAGWTLTSPFDSLVGLHVLAIDLSDNTDAGFYVAGAYYNLVLSPDETVDGLAVIREVASWDIGVAVANVTQFGGTALTSAAGIPEVKVASIAAAAITAAAIAADAITDAKVASDVTIASVTGAVGSVTGAVGSVTGLTAATVHADLDDIQARLPAALTAGGNIKADALAWNALATVALPLIPTVAGRTLDVSAGGEAGVDWANIGSPTTVQNLSATNIDVDQIVASVSGAVGSVIGLTAATVHSDLDDIQTRLPAALVSGRIDSSVGAMAANVMTAAAAAADLTTELQSGLATAAAVINIQNHLSTLETLTSEIEPDAGNSATSFKTNLTAPATDHYKDAFVKITSGALANQLREITGSTGTVDVILTVNALTATPADGVTLEVIND